MPRNPTAKKGHHNNRHENGLVGPGKRVSKQKSNNQLNGNAKLGHDEPTPPLPTVQTTLEPSTTFSAGNDHSNAHQPEELQWRKRDSESSSDSHDQKWENMNGNIYKPTRHGAATTQAKAKPANDVSAMQIASTILRSSPAGDTVALLIVLLALPSMVLTMVQALFASLTLLPPSGGLSPVAFLSLFDVFQGSTGSPSVFTMGVVDLICFGLWMSLWTWAQNLALDLAQIQIAITLGSGSSGKSGGVNTFCFLLVLLMHCVRSGGVRSFLTSRISAGLSINPRMAEMMKHLPSHADFGDSSGAPSKFRNIFAIHIISQALMAIVRRRVAGTSSASRGAKRMDDYSSVLDSSAQDTLFNTASGGLEYQPTQVLHARDSRDKILFAKKRRKQANQVRSRQPFWAALASTKVHVLREVEHSKHQQNPANFEAQRNDSSLVVSITGVEPTVVEFEIGYTNVDDVKHKVGVSPFFVRVNGARWHSVVSEPADDETCDDGFPLRWTGSIGSLAPNCPYEYTFSRGDDEEEEVIACVKVHTPAIGERDQLNIASATARTAARPLSPTTTLKSSIQQAERSRDEVNNRRNKARKSQKSSLTKLDREIETWQTKLKSGGDDNRLRQKLLQAERTSRQHEENANALTAQLDELETIPEDDVAEYAEKKAAFDLRSSQLANANEALSNAKSEANNELTHVKNEYVSTASRKERLATKNSKLQAEQERLSEANVQNMTEKERKAVESAAREADHQRQETEWYRRISAVTVDLNNAKSLNESVWREVQAFEHSQRDAYLRANGPLTPEGELPGTNPFHHRLGFGSIQSSIFVPDPHASPFHSFTKQMSSSFGRPRAGTGQSVGNMTGIVEYEEPDPIPPTAGGHNFELNGMDLDGRKSSGSSRGNNNHSPANIGVIGGGLRSPHRDSSSPGHLQSTSTW